MIFKSIKWRLQLWYGLILVVVLAGFGGTAYQLERSRQFRRVDDEIHKRIGVLANNLHRPPPRPGNGGGQFSGQPPQEQSPDDGPPEFQRRPPVFHLAPENASLFGTNEVTDFFFRITRAVENDRAVIAQSENYRRPQATVEYEHYFDQLNHVELPRERKIIPPKTVQAGDDQVVIEVLPSNEAIEVGCSLKPLRAELRATALHLAGVGAIILFFGLAGGWWFVGRALKPISEISLTATKISAGDLSQRINTAEAESELGQLAAVLNSTFARLETAFAQQKQFASDAAHELRTPVSVILTQTQTALNRERDAASYKQTVEACQRAAQRMRKLIESLLALARFDAGQEVLKQMRFDFSKLIFDCEDLVKPLADERGAKIFTELEPVEITGDSERLAQVVTNLLTNAIQYNNPGGEVRVKLESEGGLAVLTIVDTGQGIAPEDLPRVFGRFFRADQSRTGAGNSGLGLAISKAIVEAHGGTIEVSSEGNIGTTFTVRLPV
ncbi:MAG TPA: ATP-binding protein [Verrucomicrobiae bacterium]